MAVPDTGGGFGGSSVPGSSDLNSKLVDPINWLLKPPLARLRQTVLQSINTSTFTAITFTTEDVDTDVNGVGGHSTSITTSRYTANQAGWYQLSGAVGYAANATGRRLAAFYVNGTILNGSQVALAATAANDAAIPARTMVAFLNVGDYAELYGYQESGGALNTFVTTGGQSTFEIRWVSSS